MQAGFILHLALAEIRGDECPAISKQLKTIVPHRNFCPCSPCISSRTLHFFGLSCPYLNFTYSQMLSVRNFQCSSPYWFGNPFWWTVLLPPEGGLGGGTEEMMKSNSFFGLHWMIDSRQLLCGYFFSLNQSEFHWWLFVIWSLIFPSFLNLQPAFNTKTNKQTNFKGKNLDLIILS